MLDSGRNQNDNLATKGKVFDRVYEEVLKVGMRDARQAKLSVARKAGGEVTWSWTFPKPKPHASLQFLPKGHNLKHALLHHSHNLLLPGPAASCVTYTLPLSPYFRMVPKSAYSRRVDDRLCSMNDGENV